MELPRAEIVDFQTAGMERLSANIIGMAAAPRSGIAPLRCLFTAKALSLGVPKAAHLGMAEALS